MNKILLTLAAAALVGCSTSPSPFLPAFAPTAEPAPASPIPVQPSLASLDTLQASPNSKITPHATLPSPTLAERAAPGLVSPTPPQSPAAANALSRAGWKAFPSASLQVLIDYPPDWLAREDANGVTFASAQGERVFLAAIETGGLSPEDYLMEERLPNTRCSLETNAYGVQTRKCFDTLAFSYDAGFILKPPRGLARLVSLSIKTRLPAVLQVYDAMVQSLRPAP